MTTPVATSVSLPLKVKYVRVGNSGLKVSSIILGCMSYGNKDWADWVLEEAEALPHFEAAFNLGINTFDTANVYSSGDSERILGAAIKHFGWVREEIVICSKVWGIVANNPRTNASAIATDGQNYVNRGGLSRKHIFAAVKDSLARLGVDYIDLYQCHRFDPETPIAETMQALHDIVQLGYVRYIGMSSCYAYQFQQMQNYAINNKLTPFISMQDHFNAVYREEEREMFPVCELLGVGILPWSPLGRGLLTRPYVNKSITGRANSDRNFGRFTGIGNSAEEVALESIVNAVEKIATARGYSMAQIALAWNLSHKNVTAPIVGTTQLYSLVELVQATHIVLTKEEIDSINAPYVPRNIVGHV